MARTTLEDPIKVFRYKLEIAGFMGRYGFSEITGLEGETEVAEYREGGMNDTVQKSPGITKFADVTLRRGQLVGPSSGYNMLYEWYQEIFSATRGTGTAENFRRTLTLTQYTPLNQPGRVWTIDEAWPKKYKPFSDLNATSSDNSIEEVVICHEGIQLIAGF